MSENYPIDFVVTWVDGNDPVWQAEKANGRQTERPGGFFTSGGTGLP